jgi:hypothetical protein
MAEHPNMPITSDDMLLILDSGSSIAVTFDKSDFTSEIHPFQHSKIKGVAGGLAIKGIGTIQWTMLDSNNKLCHLELEALYVPDSPVCLLPPQQLSSENDHAQNRAWIGSACKVFYDNHVIEFSYDLSSNLPVKKLAPGCDKFVAFCHEVDQDASFQLPQSLSKSQEKLLCLHYRYGHTSFDTIKQWARSGKYNIDKSICNADNPICKACMFGAACKRPHNGATGSVSQVTEIKQPGDLVSADQMEAGTPGYIPFSSRCPSKHRYNTCTVWIDHYSKYIYGHLQESKDGKSTLDR